MIKGKVEKIADSLIKRKIIEADNKNVFIYGISMFMEYCLNIITALIIGLFFGLLLETIIFLLAYPRIRTYAGGYHCEKARNCYFVSCCITIGILSTVKFFPTEYVLILNIILLVTSVPVLLKLAPISTKNRILDDAEKKYFRKKTITNLCIELIIVTILFIFSFSQYAFVMTLGIFVSAILVIIQKMINDKTRRDK